MTTNTPYQRSCTKTLIILLMMGLICSCGNGTGASTTAALIDEDTPIIDSDEETPSGGLFELPADVETDTEINADVESDEEETNCARLESQAVHLAEDIVAKRERLFGAEGKRAKRDATCAEMACTSVTVLTTRRAKIDELRHKLEMCRNGDAVAEEATDRKSLGALAAQISRVTERTTRARTNRAEQVELLDAQREDLCAYGEERALYCRMDADGAGACLKGTDAEQWLDTATLVGKLLTKIPSAEPDGPTDEGIVAIPEEMPSIAAIGTTQIAAVERAPEQSDDGSACNGLASRVAALQVELDAIDEQESILAEDTRQCQLARDEGCRTAVRAEQTILDRWIAYYDGDHVATTEAEQDGAVETCRNKRRELEKVLEKRTKVLALFEEGSAFDRELEGSIAACEQADKDFKGWRDANLAIKGERYNDQNVFGGVYEGATFGKTDGRFTCAEHKVLTGMWVNHGKEKTIVTAIECAHFTVGDGIFKSRSTHRIFGTEKSTIDGDYIGCADGFGVSAILGGARKNKRGVGGLVLECTQSGKSGPIVLVRKGNDEDTPVHPVRTYTKPVGKLKKNAWAKINNEEQEKQNTCNGRACAHWTSNLFRSKCYNESKQRFGFAVGIHGRIGEGNRFEDIGLRCEGVINAENEIYVKSIEGMRTGEARVLNPDELLDHVILKTLWSAGQSDGGGWYQDSVTTDNLDTKGDAGRRLVMTGIAVVRHSVDGIHKVGTSRFTIGYARPIFTAFENLFAEKSHKSDPMDHAISAIEEKWRIEDNAVEYSCPAGHVVTGIKRYVNHQSKWDYRSGMRQHDYRPYSYQLECTPLHLTDKGSWALLTWRTTWTSMYNAVPGSHKKKVFQCAPNQVAAGINGFVEGFSGKPSDRGVVSDIVLACADLEN